jgi:DNA modification methylase
MINPKDFKKIHDWLLGGFWINQKFKDLDGNILDTKKFGSNKFKGRTHPSVAYMAIIRFTNEGDLVYIPFGGSGTEMDVCKKYNRKFEVIDINPVRDDIHTGDATHYNTTNPADLIIAHPPYESCIVYGKSPMDLSVSGDRYEMLVRMCSRKFFENLKHGGKLVLIIGDVYRDGKEIPLDFIWYKHLSQNGFKLIGRIVRDFGETKGKGKNNNLWKFRLLKFNRFWLKNDFVMIFEK